MSGVHLLAAAVTPAQRRAVFGGDDDLDEGGRRAAAALRGSVPATGDWLAAPPRPARRTARELGAAPLDVPQLADPGFGRWAGRTLDEVAGADPAGITAWLTDPWAAPHGGETLAAITARAGAWLDSRAGENLTVVAPPIMVRALLAYALRLEPAGIWQLDVAPLSLTRLGHRAGRWHLHLPRHGGLPGSIAGLLSD